VAVVKEERVKKRKVKVMVEIREEGGER